MLFSILTSCIQQESQLEQAISQSGDNHIELEKVLLHYSVNQSDSLKLKAGKVFNRKHAGTLFHSVR